MSFASGATSWLSLTEKDPAAGFNVETVEYKNISFTVWDVGGQDKVRSSRCVGLVPALEQGPKLNKLTSNIMNAAGLKYV